MYQIISYLFFAIVTGFCIWSVFCNKGNFNEKNERLMSAKSHYFALGFIFCLFLVTRFYALGDTPSGMHIDEYGMAYDAYSLGNYQVDRHLVRFPVYPINFGGGQNALYTYLTAFIFRLAGVSVFTIRLAAVISGMACLGCAYLIGREIAGRSKAALVPPFLVTVLPYFMMSERWALESHLLASYLTISIFFSIKAIKTARLKFYILAGISCGITLYTYAVCWMMFPVYFGLLLLYMIRIKRLSIKNAAAFVLAFAAMAWPLLLFMLVNNGYIPEIRTAFFSVVKVDYRGSEISLSNLKNNLSLFKMMVTNGPWNYNGVPEYGTVYIFSIPLILYGMIISLKRTYVAIKRGEWDAAVLITILFISVYGTLMLIKDPNVNKINAIYPIFVLLILLAVQSIAQRVRFVYPVLFSFYIVALLLFSNYYFHVYDTEEHPLFYSYAKWEQMLEFVNETVENKECPVYIYGVQDFEHRQLARDLYIRTFEGISPYEQNIRYQYGLPETLDAQVDAVYVLDARDPAMDAAAEELLVQGWKRYDGVPECIVLYR